MSDSEANKAIVRRYFEMFNSGDLGQLACPIESATGRCAIHTGDVWRMERISSHAPATRSCSTAKRSRGFHAI
ncbi:hypothetical protein [Mesorhizobium sp. B2-4-6]|uniref:hypothetical protein n=1 Tax=Mesorhizobium sp. B2-4-6 TaxID=2589943 RepID=UPI00112D8A60|nr:hypothetical protein [Mesorhizobium sp. B2-4-6]TPL45992.1 hypothetical protein FJ957_19650 [Mesorhizobium sp. B2-4-6]